jgi:hypothetical protein
MKQLKFEYPRDLTLHHGQLFKAECVAVLMKLGETDLATRLFCAEATSNVESITFHCRDRTDARLLHQHNHFFAQQMIASGRSVSQLRFAWPQCGRPITIDIKNYQDIQFERRLMQTNSFPSEILAVPGLQLGKLYISLPIYHVLGEFLEHPEWRQGLVRVSNQKQVAMTESSRIMTPRRNLVEAVTFRREDYVRPAELPDLLRLLDTLEPDNPDSIVEARFLADINHTNYRRFVNQYRRVTDAFGNLFEVAKNIAIEDVNPASIVG